MSSSSSWSSRRPGSPGRSSGPSGPRRRGSRTTSGPRRPNKPRRLDDEVAELGRRLFRVSLGPVSLDPHAEHPPAPPPISGSGTADDPDHPSQLVACLESTSAGCGWLLDRWAELRAILDQGLGWQSHDQLKAIRLLGQESFVAADAPLVATISRACRVLDPHRDDTFARIGTRVGGESRVPEAGRQLVGIVDRATSRLEAIAQLHQQREAAEAAELADRLSFDESNGGERLRRLQMYCGRSFLRMLDVLLKMRRPGEASPTPTARFQRAEPVSDPSPIEPVVRHSTIGNAESSPTASHTTPGIATMQTIPPVAPCRTASHNDTPAPSGTRPSRYAAPRLGLARRATRIRSRIHGTKPAPWRSRPTSEIHGTNPARDRRGWGAG